MKIYVEPRDWWVGYYRGDRHHYVCPLPTVAVRWERRPGLARDATAAALVALVMRIIATRRTRERFARVIATGDPNERVAGGEDDAP